MLFRYLQVKHAYQKQFPTHITLELDPVERLLTVKVLIAPLSSLYFHLTLTSSTKLTRVFLRWQQDIPSLSEENWETCVSSYIMNMTSARDHFIQLKFLHRAYYTPKRLAAMYPDTLSSCPRCGTSEASFIHMVWFFPSLQLGTSLR